MLSSLQGGYTIVLVVAAAWAIANCLYVYLALEGAQAFRIESATLILVSLMLPYVVYRKPREQSVVTISRARQAVLLAAVAGTWAAILLPLLGFPFLSDDYVFLARYQRVADVGYVIQFYRPLFALVFVGLSKLGGGSPVPFHLASFALHFGSALLVLQLAGRLFGSRGAAIVPFTVFLLNPVQLEAVLWISGLQDLLWSFLVLAALSLYTAERELSLGRLLTVLALGAGALASKETAVCLVLLLPAADFLFFRFKRGALQPVAYVALLSELAGYLFLRGRFVSTEPGWLVPPTTYFVKQFLVIPYTVFVHPWNRAAVDVPPVILCASAISLVVLLLLAVVRSPSARVISGPAVILISTVPLYGYFFVAPDLAGSRYLYFASVGWSLLIAELSMSLLGSERLYSALIAGLMVILAASLGLNLGPWRTAADLVETMTIGLRQARSTGDIVQDWQARQGTTVELKDGIPWKYKGVGIFSNGYPEFARLAGP